MLSSGLRRVAPPVQVGRFTIVRELGRGGMGVAYLALDEELDRKVAVKLVRPHADADVAARHRLLREAQALARLTHPNIVTIYEVGTYRSQLYVAMEFVKGQSVKDWLKSRRRTWHEVLTVFRQAGAGLRAAHVAGLVHRDFKPDNIMIGDDGRVRVLDFGLARAVDESHRDAEPVSAATRTQRRRLARKLTETGMVMGTPGYVAPEHWLRGVVDESVDQYAFCVSLYEALYGEHPYTGDTLDELCESICRGEVKAPPEETTVPDWLRDVVVRGLDPDPSRRWPSMAALLAELGRNPTRRRRRLAIAGAIAGVLAMLTALVVMSFAGRGLAAAGNSQVCVGARDHMATVWNQQRRDAVKRAFVATELPYAADTADKTLTLVDRYADDWQRGHTESCEATAVRKERSVAMMDRSMACLSGRRRALDALLGALASPDSDTLENSVPAVSRLPSIEQCSDLNYLRARVEPPFDPAAAELVEALRDQLVVVRELQTAARYDQASALLHTIDNASRDLDYAPLRAAIDLRAGILHSLKGAYEDAERDLERAFFTAQEAGHHDVAVAAATSLVRVVGAHRARYTDALQWSRHARAALSRVTAIEAEAELLDEVGKVLRLQERYEEARASFERALELREGQAHPDPLGVAASLDNLANALWLLGQYDDAWTRHERVLQLRERVLGHNHPRVAATLTSMGNVLWNMKRHQEAVTHHERALQVLVAALGPDHPDVAVALNNLANALLPLRDYDEARDHHERALAIREKALGQNHSLVATSLNNLGWVLHLAGKDKEALRPIRRALDIRERASEPELGRIRLVLTNLAVVLQSLGRHDKALAAMRRAVTLAEKTMGPDHLRTAGMLMEMGSMLLANGRHAEAVAAATRALRVFEDKADPALLDRGRQSVAEILWQVPHDSRRAKRRARRQAIALATMARKGFAARGDDESRRAVARWLRTHRVKRRRR